MSIRKKAVIVLSGGQDSTTCLFYAKSHGYELHAVTFDYCQRHVREIESAKKVAHLAGVESHDVITLGPVLKSTSPLTSDAHLEQYKDHDSLPGGIEKTFVPLRNQLFLTIAANRATSVGALDVFTGVCQEDFGGYPDCRQVFIDALEEAIFRSNEGVTPRIHFVTPVMNMTKAEEVHFAVSIPGAYAALAWSHTAYDGAYPPVGHDHATLLREKGFAQAETPDPLILRAWAEGLMELPKTLNYSEDRVQAALEVIEKDPVHKASPWISTKSGK